MIDLLDLPYRKGCDAFIIDYDNNFLLIQKQSYTIDQWNFAGGGLNQQESPEDCILRELNEELGSSDFLILKKSSIINRFEWPLFSIKNSGNLFRGQEKIQFLVKFTGDKSKIQIQQEEIRSFKWVPYNELQKHLVFKNQWENAKAVLQDVGFKNYI